MSKITLNCESTVRGKEKSNALAAAFEYCENESREQFVFYTSSLYLVHRAQTLQVSIYNVLPVKRMEGGRGLPNSR